MHESASLALVNTRILRTRSKGQSAARHPATSLLIEAGKVAEIGPTASRLRAFLQAGGEAIDLDGAVVSPGFIDAHIHAFELALASFYVSCLPPTVGSIKDLKKRLSDRAAVSSPPTWIVGTGYDDTTLAERRHPTRADLDSVIPDHPVIVRRACGHMSVVNSRALAVAGVKRDTPDPPGGAIVRDAAGNPTGLLLERAQALVSSAVPPLREHELAERLLVVGEMLLAHGITTICEALLGAFHPAETRLWSKVLSGSWAGPRVSFLAQPATVPEALDLGLPVLGTKLFADGVIAGRTASMSDPFDGGDDRGMLVHELPALVELVIQSAARGLPVGIHAMGDAGIAAAIEAVRKAEEQSSRESVPATRKLPHRLEHCALPSARSLHEMQSLGIVPVAQSVFLFAEGEAYRRNLGEARSEAAYPLRTMIDLGLSPVLSSDAPCTAWDDPANPWLGIAAAVTRTTRGGTNLGSAETISTGQAMACYTKNAASVLGKEQHIGSIAVGRDADLIILPENPLDCEPERLGELKPMAVLLKGVIRHGQL